MPRNLSLTELADRPAICRFAPSPNGDLHLGHGYSVLANERFADLNDATLLLRFEDIDRERCRSVYEQAIEADLGWLGVAWQPPALRQSSRFEAYDDELRRLAAENLVFPCFCSRGDIARAVGSGSDWPRDPDGAPLYPGTCRELRPDQREIRLRSGQSMSIRLDMASARAKVPGPIGWQEYRDSDVACWMDADPRVWGDVVLARKTVPTSYHLAVVIDDAAQCVTDVIRGEDLLPSTALHRLLQVLLGYTAPRYHHHRLVLDENGRKLSKSAGSRPLSALRAAGVSAAVVRAQLGFPPV